MLNHCSVNKAVKRSARTRAAGRPIATVLVPACNESRSEFGSIAIVDRTTDLPLLGSTRMICSLAWRGRLRFFSGLPQQAVATAVVGTSGFHQW